MPWAPLKSSPGKISDDGYGTERWVIPADCWCHSVNLSFWIWNDGTSDGYVEFEPEYQPEHWLKSANVSWRDLVPFTGYYAKNRTTREGLSRYWEGTRLGQIWRIIRKRPLAGVTIELTPDVARQTAEILNRFADNCTAQAKD